MTLFAPCSSAINRQLLPSPASNPTTSLILEAPQVLNVLFLFVPQELGSSGKPRQTFHPNVSSGSYDTG